MDRHKGRLIGQGFVGLVDGPNLYRYARNNPVRMTDRRGSDPDDEVEGQPDAFHLHSGAR